MPEPTHFIRWDEPGKRLRRALCGVLVDTRTHANAPTCPECRDRLHAWDAEELDEVEA